MTEKQLDLIWLNWFEEAFTRLRRQADQQNRRYRRGRLYVGCFRAAYRDASVPTWCWPYSGRPTRPLGFENRRVKAVSHFTRWMPSALAAANKRVSNILAKVEGELPTAVKPELLVDAAETATPGCRTA